MLDKADFTDQKGRLIPDISLSSIQSRFIPSAAPRARGKEPSATAISALLGPIPAVTVKLIAIAQAQPSCAAAAGSRGLLRRRGIYRLTSSRPGSVARLRA